MIALVLKKVLVLICFPARSSKREPVPFSLVIVAWLFAMSHSAATLAMELPKEPSVANQLVRLGQEYYEAGKYGEALHEFRKALLITPDHPQALHYVDLLTTHVRQEEVHDLATEQTLRAAAMEQALHAAEAGVGGQPSAPLVLEGDVPGEASAGSVVSPAAPRQRQPGEIRLVLDGEEVILDEPIVMEGGRMLIPIRPMATALGLSVLDLGDGQLQLIFPNGQVQVVSRSITQTRLLMTEKELEDWCDVQTSFDDAEQTLYVVAGLPAGFLTYEIPKPEEQVRAEEAARKLVEAAQHDLDEERARASEAIPEAAEPDVQLAGNVSYSYNDPHAAPPLRNLTTRITGEVYDTGISFEDQREDLGGVFQHNYTYLNLTKPGLFVGLFDQSTNLRPLRTQFEDFEGVKVIKDWQWLGRHRTTVAGGDIENTVSGIGTTVKYLGRLYEAREDFRPADWLRLQQAWLYLENEADLPERTGLSEFPRNNLVSFSGMELTAPEDLTWSAYAAHSGYEADNEPDGSVEDWNWRTAVTWDRRPLRLSFDYEFVGDRYASLGNPDAYQDFKGWNLTGNYRVTDEWSLSGGLRRYRNNVDEDDVTTQENQAVSLSSSYQLASDQTFNLSLSDVISNPSGPAAASSSHLRQYRVDYLRPFLFDARLLGSYQYSRNELPAGSDEIAHRLGTTLFGSLGRGSTWRFSEDVEKAYRELEADQLNLISTLNLELRLGAPLSLYSNSSYTRDLTDAQEHTDTISQIAGLRYQLSPNTALRAEYQINSYSLDTNRHRWPKNWSILFFLSQKFGLTSPPNFGAIDNWVFRDLNANGTRDASEPWVSGATVVLEDAHRELLTDEHGDARFSRVVPGVQTVTLDLSNLDPTWLVQESRRTVEVKKRRTVTLWFPVVQGVVLHGRVFIDDNGDGLFQLTEEPVEGIAVILTPGEQFSRTNADGEFRFDALLPGTYTVRIYEEDLPTGYEVARPEPMEIILQPEHEVPAVDLAVRLIPGVEEPQE